MNQPSRPAPIDQAHGLRQMFVQHSVHLIPVAANAFVPFAGVLLERLCSAFAELDLRVLVVDASESAQAPNEWTPLDLAEGIETLSPHVSYLSAPGMPMHHLDAEGSTVGFLEAVAQAAAFADVVLVHAGAAELSRMFSGVAEASAPPRLLVLCDDKIDSIKQAYANVKFMATRTRMRVHDTLLALPPESEASAQVAERLRRCGEAFLGTVQHACVAVDPLEPACTAPSDSILTLATELHRAALVHTVTDTAFGALMQARPAASASHAL